MQLTAPLRFLLVEDNPADAELTIERFREAKDCRFEVTHVTTSQGASDAIRHKPFDLVILDLNLPDSRGIETLRLIRNAAADVALVVQSGDVSEELREQTYAEGAMEFIGKNEPSALLLTRGVLHAIERHRGQENQRQVQRMLSAIPDAVVVADFAGLVLYSNQAAADLFGKSREDLHELALPIGLEVDTQREMQIWRRDELRQVDVRVVHFMWKGKPALLATMRDTTEQRRVDDRLNQVQRLESIGRLAGGIAHDFNNLLTIINGCAEMLLDDDAATAEARHYLGDILGAGERAAALTRQLLAFSRKSMFSPQHLDLNLLVAQIDNMLRRMIGEDIEFKTLLSPGLAKVYADPSQIEQVLMNLVVNARDAMPSGGKLLIETGTTRIEDTGNAFGELGAGDYTVLAVSDTGCGMDEETKKHIFEPFFTTKEQGKGTGLGLATVYGIVRQTGGCISVYSEPQRGTTFKVYLPIARSNVGVSEQAPARAAVRGGGESILVVEDEDGVRKFVRKTLESYGYSVLEAANGSEGLKIATNSPHPIDLVLTDVIMPKMSGQQLAEQLRGPNPDLPIIFMSGYTDDAIILHGILEENAPFIQKPFTPSKLALKIRDVLDARVKA